MRLPAGDSGVPLSYIGNISMSQAAINRDVVITADLETVKYLERGHLSGTSQSAFNGTQTSAGEQHQANGDL